ncbi:hypothetical protein [Xanthomonas massiliensis]|uniref:hypothetical protein n=1 Tax=Xanthomonas massiliensis TaxID=1720302 RepID=UPI0008266D45|nr:hypothetical protein [Xanthomonas massiliensis]
MRSIRRRHLLVLALLASCGIAAAKSPAGQELTPAPASPLQTRSTTTVTAPQTAPRQVPPARSPVEDAGRGNDTGATGKATPPYVTVYDRQGRRLPAMRQAGAGRVQDTRTGRYYDTVPSGDGQRIQGTVPPAKP